MTGIMVRKDFAHRYSFVKVTPVKVGLNRENVTHGPTVTNILARHDGHHFSRHVPGVLLINNLY